MGLDCGLVDKGNLLIFAEGSKVLLRTIDILVGDLGSSAINDFPNIIICYLSLKRYGFEWFL